MVLRRMQFFSDAESGGPPAEPTSKPKELAAAPAFVPITSQESFDFAIAERLRRQEDTVRKTIREEVAAELKVKADEDARKEQGDFKTLYETAEAKRRELEQTVQSRELADRKREIAAKHNLPSWLADRLQGENEADLEKDAKQIALAAKERDVDNDAGKRTVPKLNGDATAPRPPSFSTQGPFVERPGFETKKE